MKRMVWMVLAAAVVAVTASGCLLIDADDDFHGDCCYSYQQCETTCDMFGHCDRDCWYEDSCPSSCGADYDDDYDDDYGDDYDDDGPEPQCYSDLDCHGDDICVDRRCERPDTTDRGDAGVCQACETNSDCANPDALCVRLGRSDDAVAETICSTPCAAGCPSGFECETIGDSEQCLPTPDADGIRSCGDTPGLECTTASDCQPAESCVDNVCEAPDSAECSADSDCGVDQHCRRRECVDDAQPECVTRTDCASTQVCVDGACVDGTQSCVFNTECSEDGLCVDGQCYASCADDAACAANEQCRQGVCRPIDCRGTADCAGDEVCVDATCRPACSPQSGADQCAPGYECTGHGYCGADPDVECRSSAECARDQMCNDGVCEVPCGCNQDCPSGLVCNLDQGRCEDPDADDAATCETNCDCPSGQQCSNGICG